MARSNRNQWHKSNRDIHQRKKLSEAHKKRAAIEPIIGHIKTDHRLNRNFYKGIVGDNINIILAAAAFNFKRIINKWKSSFLHFFQSIQIYLKALYYFQMQIKENF